MPAVHSSCYVHKAASVIGNVELKEGVSVWPGASIRGDFGSIVVGKEANVQDNASLHADPDFPCVIGQGVTIGHNAVVHGCTVEDLCLIGMNSTILNGAVIGKGSVVGAGSVVKEGMIIPPGSLVVGVPAKVVKSGVEHLADVAAMNAQQYVTNGKEHKEGKHPEHAAEVDAAAGMSTTSHLVIGVGAGIGMGIVKEFAAYLASKL